MDERPDLEGFGEAGLGEAQSEDPPADPEMLRDDEREASEPPEEDDPIEGDPAYDPEDEGLKRIKGG